MSDFCDLPPLDWRAWWPNLDHPSPPTPDQLGINQGYLNLATNTLRIRRHGGIIDIPLPPVGGGIEGVELTMPDEFIVEGSGTPALEVEWERQDLNTVLGVFTEDGGGDGKGQPEYGMLTSGHLPIVPIEKGGTEADNAIDALNNLSPLNAEGDLLTYDGTEHQRLPAPDPLQSIRRNATGDGWEGYTPSSGSSGYGASSQIIPSGNTITVTGIHHEVMMGGANKIITTINKTGVAEGDVLLLRPSAAGFSLTLRPSATLVTPTGFDASIRAETSANNGPFFLLAYNGGRWVLLNNPAMGIVINQLAPTWGVETADIPVDHFEYPRGLKFPIGSLNAGPDPSTDGVYDLDLLPNWLGRSFYGFRSHGATIQAVGAAAPTIVGTPTSLAPNTGTGVAVYGPTTNLAQAAATSNTVRASIADSTNLIYNPEFFCRIETRSATDLTSVRIWIGLFNAVPTNAAEQAAAHVSFRFDPASDVNWKFVTDTGAAVSTMVDTGMPVMPNTYYNFYIRVTSAKFYWRIFNLKGSVNNPIGYVSTPVIPVMSQLQSVAAARNIGFLSMMVAT